MSSATKALFQLAEFAEGKRRWEAAPSPWNSIGTWDFRRAAKAGACKNRRFANIGREQAQHDEGAQALALKRCTQPEKFSANEARIAGLRRQHLALWRGPDHATRPRPNIMVRANRRFGATRSKSRAPSRPCSRRAATKIAAQPLPVGPGSTLSRPLRSDSQPLDA